MICFFLLMVSILVDDGSASWVKVTNSPVVLQSEIIINYKIDNFNPARYIIIIITIIIIIIIIIDNYNHYHLHSGSMIFTVSCSLGLSSSMLLVSRVGRE